MNERIKELYSKIAGKDWMYDFDPDKAEMFAELIIKETLQVARAGIEFGDGMEDAVYKYFGVEE